MSYFKQLHAEAVEYVDGLKIEEFVRVEPNYKDWAKYDIFTSAIQFINDCGIDYSTKELSNIIFFEKVKVSVNLRLWFFDKEIFENKIKKFFDLFGIDYYTTPVYRIEDDDNFYDAGELEEEKQEIINRKTIDRDVY